MQTIKKILGALIALSVLVLFGAAGAVETKTAPFGTAALWSVAALIVLGLSVYGFNRIGGDRR